jgi:DNA-binding IclR family transcriptional regulator
VVPTIGIVVDGTRNGIPGLWLWAFAAVPIVAVAAPVAAIAIHAATARLPLNQAMEYIPQLREAATRISNTLGG